MIIKKECYECGKVFDVEEEDVVNGLITIPADEAIREDIIAWICPDCIESIEGLADCDDPDDTFDF